MNLMAYNLTSAAVTLKKKKKDEWMNHEDNCWIQQSEYKADTL